jgi:hypothetical protein
MNAERLALFKRFGSEATVFLRYDQDANALRWREEKARQAM